MKLGMQPYQPCLNQSLQEINEVANEEPSSYREHSHVQIGDRVSEHTQNDEDWQKRQKDMLKKFNKIQSNMEQVRDTVFICKYAA